MRVKSGQTKKTTLENLSTILIHICKNSFDKYNKKFKHRPCQLNLIKHISDVYVCIYIQTHRQNLEVGWAENFSHPVLLNTYTI